MVTMISFNMARLPRTYFGSGAFTNLYTVLENLKPGVILLLTGGVSFLSSSQYQQLTVRLKAMGIGVIEARVGSEPSPGMVDDISQIAREAGVALVAAIGGGSVMDAGKAVSAMIPVQGSVRDYLEGVGTKTHPGCKVPLVAIPTTSGTGSEATKNAVLSETGPGGYKKSLRHDHFVPDYAIIDPELTLSCPPDITAASGMDALNQLLEAFLSVKATPVTDALALSGIEAVFEALEPLVNGQGDSLALREKMAYGAYVSGIALAHAGLGIVHGFASSLGGLIPVPHGNLCGKLNAEVITCEINGILDDPGLYPKYQVKLRKLFSAAGIEDRDLIEGAQAFSQRLYTMETHLMLPGLETYGLTYEIAKAAAGITSCKESPVKISELRMIEILMNNR